MKRSLFFAVALVMTLLTACTNQQESKDSMQTASFIPDLSVNEVIAQLKDSVGEDHTFRIERGVRQVADLWQEQDGTVDDFAQFCTTSFVADKEGLASLFATLERNFEVISGYYHKMDVELKIPLQLVGPDITPVDMQFGSYNASAHLTDDLYDNKIAFLTALNFPFYSLEEKTELGEQWSREEWAYARMGDRFISRVPAAIQQDISRTVTEADAYISDYNIFMGKLRNEQGEQLFPDGMKLISHWGLRDELKSNYADPERGLEKQRMIYKVMQRIVDQSIPLQVINNDSPTWIPETNELTENGQTITATPEDIRRYEVFLKNFQAMRKLDAYSPHYPTQLVRAFDGTMEVPQKDVEELFKGLLSSPQVKEVASFIASRLGRELEPFDIWYNGFRAGEEYPKKI